MIVLAGLMGASGIILAAAAAHTAPGAGLDSAAYMLLFHATAVLSGTVLLQQGLLLRPMMLGVLAGWVLGSALFSGDIALRAGLDGSNAQHEQSHEADSGEQRRECDGIVFEPMPIRKHDVHPLFERHFS
jgi:uncharacterized membrane protein YgdD (TMEM256/DUF423 family)